MGVSEIDVLIPVFNAAKTIESAIASIQSQTFQNIRLIVVDDGSSDATPNVLNKLAASDARILVHRQENSGIVDALNTAVRLSTSDVIARHDADDLAYPDRLKRQLDYLNQNPDCVAVGASVRHIDCNGQPVGSVGVPNPIEFATADWIPCREPYLIHPVLMARRDAIVEVGGYRHVVNAEDSDLYWRLRARGRLYNLPDRLADYRLHDESISGRSLHGGRLTAVFSQLAGLSAKRRADRHSDIDFTKALATGVKARTTLQDMIEEAAVHLDHFDRGYMEIRVAAKMLELASYRPFELEVSDCRFIKKAIAGHLSAMPNDNRRAFIRQISGTAARLAANGHFAEAKTLLPRRLYHQAALRYTLRAVLPNTLRRRMRLVISAGVPVK